MNIIGVNETILPLFFVCMLVLIDRTSDCFISVDFCIIFYKFIDELFISQLIHN